MMKIEMMEKALYKTITCLSIAILLAVAIAACSSEDAVVDDLEDGGAFTVTAEVARQLYSRGYDEGGYIRSGIYCLSYLKTDNSYDIASVDFHKNEETTPGLGIVTVPENQSLKWKNIGGGSPVTFYLDNVDPKIAAETSSPTEIVFGENNPYKAGVFDEEEKGEDETIPVNENDLLWGSSMVARNANSVDFELHHRMARVRVQVTTDEKYAQDDELSLENAKVSISSLVHTPVSYNRLNGTLSLGANLKYEDLEFVNANTPWASMKPDENNSAIKVYTTKDFVLPPQDLLENENRPKLTVKLKNGRVYSGILPHAMEIDDDNPEHTVPSKPAALSFLGEHILTIRTMITEDLPTLAFMPVWVVKWVDKGIFDLEAHQAGIYTKEEFDKLIEYYQKNNKYQLVRYGRLVTEEETPDVQRWVFDFFHSVTLDKNKISGSMKQGNGQEDFSFNFNNYAIYVLDGGSEISVTPEQLYEIVTRQ